MPLHTLALDSEFKTHSSGLKSRLVSVWLLWSFQIRVSLWGLQFGTILCVSVVRNVRRKRGRIIRCGAHITARYTRPWRWQPHRRR